MICSLCEYVWRRVSLPTLEQFASHVIPPGEAGHVCLLLVEDNDDGPVLVSSFL